jgi:hypothetical protein
VRIEIERKADGRTILRCTRADGSVTWQVTEGRTGAFFASHDVTHFAVETALGFTRGFFGLIAAGWDIAETGGKGRRGRVPDEGIVVEHVVGLLERERLGGAPPLSAADFNAQLEADLGRAGIALTRRIADTELCSVRDRIDELRLRIGMLPPGEPLALTFPS